MQSRPQDDQPDLTILLPCLNEAATVLECLDAAKRGVLAAGVTAELLVADNGSTDASARISEQAGARVIHVNAKGYGEALRAGIHAARGRWILMGDADASYDFASAPAFVTKLRNGADFVIGCRFAAGGGRILPGAMPWKHRWIGNPALTAIGRLLFGCPVHDFHCGLRAFSRDAVVRLELTCSGMEFASELIVKAHQAGLRIAEVPVTLSPDRRGRPPHLRSWRDGFRHLGFLIAHRLRTLRRPAHSRHGRPF